MNTMQFEFDAVVEHLFKQGQPAWMDGACVYRGKDGAMCAVGCRIPDDVYEPRMENKVVYMLVKDHASVLPPEIVAYGEMFENMQEVHDGFNGRQDKNESWPDYMNRNCARVALNCNLTFTPR